MDELVELGLVVAFMGASALVADRLMRGESPPGWPLGAVSLQELWQRSMPLPRGVQEDAEIAWHVPVDRAPLDPARPPVRDRPTPPTRPQPRIVGR
jgi:hypothetical protein